MRVKVGNRVYGSETHPIMVILSEKDKENIAAMVGTRLFRYAQQDADADYAMTEAQFREWTEKGVTE